MRSWHLLLTHDQRNPLRMVDLCAVMPHVVMQAQCSSTLPATSSFQHCLINVTLLTTCSSISNLLFSSTGIGKKFSSKADEAISLSSQAMFNALLAALHTLMQLPLVLTMSAHVTKPGFCMHLTRDNYTWWLTMAALLFWSCMYTTTATIRLLQLLLVLTSQQI